MGIGARLSTLLTEKNTNPNELAKIVGVSPQTIYSIIKRDSKKADIEVLLKISDVLGVSVEYFVDDPALLAVSQTKVFSTSDIKFLRTYHALDDHGKKAVDFVLEHESERVTQLHQKNARIYELEAKSSTITEFQPSFNGHGHLSEYFRSASAGSGVFILGNEASAKILVSDSDWDDRTDYVISVAGDSMSPDYCDGDKVLVSQRTEMRHGDVGIFIINGNVYIKEYGENELVSRNPEAPNIPIAEYDNIVCMGKVIGKIAGPFHVIEE